MKYSIYALLGLLALAIAAAVVFAVTFDPNRYKDEVERLVKERTGRTLALKGDLAVAFWPSLGARVAGVTLSERASDAQFLALESAHASVALMPLLRGEVVVDGVRVAGLKAQVIKDKNGRFNFQDLLGEDKPGAQKPAPREKKAERGEPVQFDIAGVTVERSAVSYRDLATGQELALSDFNLGLGRVAEKAEGDLELSVRAKGNQPALDAQVKVSSGYRFDLPAKSFALSKLEARVTGAAAGLTGIDLGAKGDLAASPGKNEYRVSGLEVLFKAMQGKDALEGKVAAPSLVIAADTAKGEAVSAELRLNGEKRSAHAVLKLSGLEGSAKALAVPQFTADLALTDPALPMKSVKIPVSGSLKADLEKQTADADIKAKIDESNVQAKLGLAKFSPPAYRFDVGIDRLDVDRYFPPEPKAAASGRSKEPSGRSKERSGKEADTPVDLSALKGLDASGRARIGELEARGLRLAKVEAEVRAANGRAEIAPHRADLYEGSVSGAITLQADGNRVSVKEKLAGVSIGPLLRDFAQQDRLEGRGNVSLDVTSAGATVEAMKKALSGSAAVELRNGAIKGINIAEVLRKAKAALGREEAQAAAAQEKTDFSELSATFTIRNGVARNKDLDVKAPLFRITGAGEIDIGRSRLDYETKVAVVATSKGQGGAELEELRGVTVPVQLSGPLEDPSYKVDYRRVAADLAKSRAGEKVRSRVEKSRERLEDKLKGLIRR